MSQNHLRQSAEEFHSGEFPQQPVCILTRHSPAAYSDVNFLFVYSKPMKFQTMAVYKCKLCLSLQHQEHSVDVHAYETGFSLFGFTAAHG